MAKVLITLLGILLLLNAMTFLLVAFQDPGGEATAEDNATGSVAIATLEKKVDALNRKVDGLNTLKTTLTRQHNDIRALTRKIDGLARAQTVAQRAPPPPRTIARVREPEEVFEEEQPLEEPLEEPVEESVEQPAEEPAEEEVEGEVDQG